ncbi:MAG: helix-turn-helix transcriptional regulator [Candidatus Omnitrophica bacterium]|nr:helix-turn-helix transcriptional regulator [Candidatus Omnitrophota bacterium]
MENLGAAIRKRREKLGLKVYELADAVDVDPVYITRIEKHGKLPSPLIMEKISKALSDEELFKVYLKMKYPMVYDRIKPLDTFLDVEIEKIMEEMGKKDITSEEAKKLEWRIARFETLTKKAKIKLQKLTKKLEEIERI